VSALTTKLSLYLPGGGSSGLILPDESLDVDRINDNMKLIDAAIGTGVFTSGTRPSTPFPGQTIYESDTRNYMYWSIASSRWVPIGTPNAASDALRDALFPVPQLGNRVFRTDKGYEQRYTGTSWVGVGSDAVFMTPASVTGTTPAVGNATIQPSGRVSFSGMSKLFLNGIFNAEFESYEIEWEIDSMAGDALILCGFGTGGTQDTAANYNYLTVSGGGGTLTQTQSAAQSTFSVGRCAAGGGTGKFLVNGPFLARRTRYMADSADTTLYRLMTGGYNGTSTSYTDLIITMPTTAVNGWITVRGVPL